MLNAASYRPDPGSLSDRLLRWFAANPEDELSYRDIASKFDVIAPGNVLPSIMSPITKEILTRSKDGEGRTVVRTGSAFLEWQAATADGAPSDGETGAAQTPRRARVPSAPPADFDPTTVTIHEGVKRRMVEPIWQKFLRVFERMTPESHVRMARDYKASAGTALTKWRSEHPDQHWRMETIGAEIVINRLA